MRKRTASLAAVALLTLGLGAVVLQRVWGQLPVSRSEDRARTLALGLIAKLDQDKDGKLTRTELNHAEGFSRLDQNKDGQVSREEVIAAKEAIRDFLEKRRGGENLRPSASAEPARPVAQGAMAVKPGEVGVGRQLPDLLLTDLQGTQHQLSRLAAQGKGLVIAITSTTCPVSQRYLPSLARLQQELREKGISLLLLNPMRSEKKEDMTAAVQQHQLTVPYVQDATAAAALAARSTTEVLLMDATRTLLYRGALDDQYGVSYNLDAPQQQYLRDAVEDHLSGRLPHLAATEAPGCELDAAQPTTTTTTALTYHRDISRILQQNCVSCHHEGGSAPFALDDPTEVLDRARTIQRVITEGNMPPWFAKEEPAGKASPWANERSLATRDKADLLAWLSSADRPLGNVADAPAPLKHSAGGWRHGEPDKVITFTKPQPVKAEGKMPYQNITVDTGLTEDTWIRGYEVQPGAKAVVHHVLVFLIQPGEKRRIAEHDGFFAAFVPGSGTEWLPAGFGKKIPAGAQLRFQMHYTPNGTATEDSTRIGLYFAKETPKQEVLVSSVTNVKLSIPPYASDHEVVAQRSVPQDITLLSFSPHMHVRGKSYRYELVQQSGTTTLLDIPRYDFNWQLQYRLKQPLHLPRGSLLKGIAHYDNSEANKANPDPSKLVRWGPQTEDEMMIGYLTYYVPVGS